MHCFFKSNVAHPDLRVCSFRPIGQVSYSCVESRRIQQIVSQCYVPTTAGSLGSVQYMETKTCHPAGSGPYS
jgi:hypothetical protein